MILLGITDEIWAVEGEGTGEMRGKLKKHTDDERRGMDCKHDI